jgi:predicted DNA-binding transcriptional regulator AlpA
LTAALTALTAVTAWSLRQCLDTAERLQQHRSAPVLAGLCSLADAVTAPENGDEPYTELTDAADRINELHRLVDHLVANLKALSIPPTPQPPAPRRELPPITHPVRSAMPRPARATRARHAPGATAQEPRIDGRRNAAVNGRNDTRAQALADGLLGKEEVLALLGIKHSRFYKRMASGEIPGPLERRRGMSFWRRDQFPATAATSAA